MDRITKIVKLLTPTKGAIITSDNNRQYLTGFRSSAGVLLLTVEESYFIIDSRYYENARQLIKNCKVILINDFNTQLTELCQRHNINSLAIENQEMTIHKLNDYQTRFPDIIFDSSSWLSDSLIGFRIIKSEDEIKNIQNAQQIAEKAFNKILTKIRPGVTEKQISALLNYYIMGLGADDISFPSIVASGKNGAIPHSEPTDKPLASGEFLLLDFGAVYKGYHSDMSRTIAVGEPTEEMKNVYNAVLGAGIDAMKSVRDGVSGKLVDNVARSTLEAWGYDKYFGHGLGHGVGLQIHEAPSLSPKGEYTLKEGMVITIEPGVYIPGKFGVRIEDMLYVTKDGCINLTKAPKSIQY